VGIRNHPVRSSVSTTQKRKSYITDELMTFDTVVR